MKLGQIIQKLRTDANLSQEKFAALFPVSQQSVQKWESGEATPDLDKIVKISKQFGISLDALILGNDPRVVEEMKSANQLKPQYATLNEWEFYPAILPTEYRQSTEEGLDIEQYKDLFADVARLPNNEVKKQFGDILFDIVANAPQKQGYPYIEPSSLEGIRELRKPYTYPKTKGASLESRIAGAWSGRISGCMLGKTVEGIRTNEFHPFLKETGNFPMHRYIYSTDLTEEILNKYQFPFASRPCADRIDGMPVDDDTNYTVLYQEVIEKYGKDFTPYDVSRAWLYYQNKDAYCTAERIAFCNFVKGFVPPASAAYQNPFREWIGAQIRADYFGYINPGNPELAAEMAWRDASVSHIKNGIYGEMFVAAMLAVAAETNHISDILLGGLAQIPETSRLYEKVYALLQDYQSGVSQAECFRKIHQEFDEHSPHDWCHTISNALVVVASLLYGNGDFGKSICMSVEAGFDTDCNGATVGSILGMANGLESIPEYWTKPFQDTVHTSIFGIGSPKLSQLIKKTLSHIAK